MSLFKTGLRYLLRRPLQSILCILGVALGVAVVIAIDLANGSASRAFELSTETVAGKATHQVVRSNDVLDVAVYRRIKTELGIAEAAPVVTAYATALELDQQPVRVLGIDIFAEGPFRSYLGDGASAFRQNGLAQFLTEPHTLLIGEATAQRYSLQSGMTLTLRIGNVRTPFRIIGILQPTDDNGRRALDGIAIMDIGAAQALFGMGGVAGQPGKLSHIDLIADERTEAGRARLARIQSVLPTGVQIIKPSTRSQSVESLTDAFKLNLTALSLLALVVGMFLIYNTITFSVVQRRPTIGTLRCLGVTRGEIFRMILLETLLLGALGGILGVGLGIVLGRGAVGLVTQTINDLYYVVNVRDIAVDPLTLLKGFVLGVGAALLAALAPAYEATSIPPVGALRRSSIEGRVRRLLPYVAAVGVLLFAIGGAMLLLTQVLVVNLGGIFGVLIGIALMSPLITILFMRLASPVLGRLIGVIGRMAPRGVVNSISRTAIAIASLLVAVSVIIGLQSMIGSFRNTVQSWLDVSLAADIFITPPSSGVGDAQSAIAPEIIDEFRALPGAGDVTLLRRVSIEVQTIPAGGQADGGWRTTTLTAIESVHERPDKEFLWSERPVDGIWASMTGQDEVQVSEPFANKFGVTQQNNMLAVRTNAGERTMRVVGVFYDYASDAGVVRVRRDLYQRYWADDKVSSIALYLPTNSSITAQSLRTQFSGRDLLISANRELRDNALQVFDRTFAITSALNLLATVVAFIGVLSALMALQIERTRELGMLRANGMTLRQLWQLTLLETGLMGGTAGILSMPAGLLLAVILVYIINLRSFGWTIRLDLQWTTFAQALAVAVVSALLAAIYPMLRLSKIAIASAVRQE